MKVKIFETKQETSKAAAKEAVRIITSTIKEKSEVVLIAATGTSQFEFLENLTSIPFIDWSKITMFHLDEYIGIPETHSASFRKYLKEKLIDKVDLGSVYLIKGDTEDPDLECERLDKIIGQKEVDIAFIGIGENAHLAFNDPLANFDTEKPYIVVELSESCKRQQLSEGWFKSIDEVPRRAISMSIKQIMKSKNIICIVPDSRKAQAVKDCLEGDISPYHPASILRKHKNTFLFLDKDSANLLKKNNGEF